MITKEIKIFGLNRIAAEQSKLRIILLILLGAFFAQASCSAFAQNRKIKLNETFTLQPGEAAETEDARLKVQLKEVGREISESGEVEYVKLQIRFEKSEQSLVIREENSAAKVVGDFLIELIDAESFGKTNCRLKISRGNFWIS